MSKPWLAGLALSGALGAWLMGACGVDEPETPQPAAGGSAGQADDAGEAQADSNDEPDALPRPATMLGARCKGDGDCGEGLFCSPPTSTDWAGEGPAHGYCTSDCSQDGDSVCTAIEPSSFCHGPAEGVRHCLLGCTPGGTDSELDFDIMKCWARQDVACSPFAPGESPGEAWACWPTCGDDSDCPGVPCDRGTGLCSAGYEGGLPLGSGCSEWVASEGDAGERCAGYCGDPTRGENDAGGGRELCLERCVLGDPDACGFPKGLCVPSGEAPSGFGDLGQCRQTCESDEDCLGQASGVRCDKDAVAGVGLCTWPG